MQISDQELRTLVREAIARVGPTSDRASSSSLDRAHPSLGLLPLTRGSDADGACLIEPAVRCSHCGYCVSFGH